MEISISPSPLSKSKLPPGVQMPEVEPKLTAPFLGFTKTAEIWNSRACMIGLIGTFIVELVLQRRGQWYPIIVSSIPIDTKCSYSLRDPSEVMASCYALQGGRETLAVTIYS